MRMIKVRVVLKNIGEPAKVVEIRDDVKSLQFLIGSPVQIQRLQHSAYIVMSETALYKELPPNLIVPLGFLVWAKKGLIYGNVLIVKTIKGKFIDLPDKEIKWAVNWLNAQAVKAKVA